MKTKWETVSNLKKIGSKSCNLLIGKCTDCWNQLISEDE